MEAKILIRRENGEHDILLLCPEHTIVEIEGEPYEIFAVWSYLLPPYNGRETFVKMTDHEMERLNRIIGRRMPVTGEPGYWWVYLDTDEVRKMISTALSSKPT